MIIALQTLIYFRESLLFALERLLRPYYKKLFIFNRYGSDSDDEESEDQVFAEFDDEKGVVFYPPVYAQRYAAVSDCLMDERWCGKLEKVVDLGYHDMSFIRYLKEVPGIKNILGVDIESIPLRCSSDLLRCDDYVPKRESPLQVTLFQGNAADPDYRLIGCDAVVAIEMIEHMLPHDLERLVHTVFGFVKPWIVVFTTPNADFNVLFKALERNGLRRLDHFFEWTREQFHDWCSNIVARYPQYTVSCKGIGPGPPGTKHYGCCSQLALFISKDYHKQEDLSLNSLALVANAPNPSNYTEIIGNLEEPENLTDNNMIYPVDNPSSLESYSDLIPSMKHSCMTLVLSPAFSADTLEYTDKTSQCNLDTETGKNFLMFDTETGFNIVVPRRKLENNRVYEIEDVTSRLNCTTMQVKKFSKTTQNLMAKNKIDTLVHTREVVDEIRHLTKMLNFNKENTNVERKGIWFNINWGENAPYWNQYYKVVRECNYPFEKKSEECRILDLISDEINRLIDMHCDEEFSVDVNKMEIPVSHLMRVVQHITDDEDRVKDLLEWNGYQIVDDVVIHSRLVMDNASIGTYEDDWPDNDTISDFDTIDAHSTSLSDASTIVPDFNGRCLRRALDQKVRKLRTMLTADEDISTELDKVVCRLMKLALRTSKGRKAPPPTRWMQCKLFDLLTLTEKAIERRKKYFIDNYPLKALDCEYQGQKAEDVVALARMKEDNTVDQLVDKYRHLVSTYENKDRKQKVINNLNLMEFDLEDNISATSNECFKDSENISGVERLQSTVNFSPQVKGQIYNYVKQETKLERIQAWVDDDVEVVSYPNHDIRVISSENTDNNIPNNDIMCFNQTKLSHKHKEYSDQQNPKLYKKSKNKSSHDKHYKIKYENRTKTSKSKLMKKVPKKSDYDILIKTCSNKILTTEYKHFRVKSKKSIRKHTNLQSTASKPIPEPLVKLCQPDPKWEKEPENINVTQNMCDTAEHHESNVNSDVIENNTTIASTEESLLIDIVMDDGQETIALRRTIGTDADDDPIAFEQETILGSLINVMRDDSYCNKYEIATENVHSQTIFLYDINEPSTSKGVRHVSMDVQCGPDVTQSKFPMLSATTSFTKIPKIYSTGIKIGSSGTDINNRKSSDFGTCTDDCNNNCKILTPRMRSAGIKIKDSDPVIYEKVESSTITSNIEAVEAIVSRETQFIKPFSSRIKIDDSGSEIYDSVGSYPKSPNNFAISSKNTSDIYIKTSESKEVGVEHTSSATKYIRPRLSRGGVHVHSYRDKQNSEDVFYQGEWQRHKPKALAKKRVIYNSITVKRVTEINKKFKVNSKEKIKSKKPEKDVKLEERKPVQLQNMGMNKVKDDVTTKKLPCTNNLVKAAKCNRNVAKVSSKMSLITSKSAKPIYGSRKAMVLVTPAISKIEGEPLKRLITKCYLPPYLRKRKMKCASDKSALSKSIDSAETVIKVNKDNPKPLVPPLVRSKTEDLKKDLLKFRHKPRENISYVVFRNEVDKTSSAENESPVNTKESDKRKENMGSHTPQSQNSSTCSSPNSVATVRAVSTRLKTWCSRRHSTSSNKSSVDSENNITATRNKKFTKKSKPSKKPDDKDIDNKENIPESLTKSDITKKESSKIGKGAYVGTNKSVYRAQLATENTQLQNTLNSLSRHKDQVITKSNIKLLNSAEIKSVSPSISQVRCSKPSLLICNDRETNSKKASVLISYHSQIEEQVQSPTLGHDTEKIIKCSIKSEIKNNVDTNIFSAMREIVEESLDFIDQSANYATIDSATVILNREDLRDPSLFDCSPQRSFKTVISNEGLNSSLKSDIENAMNRTFDSIIDEESFSSMDTQLPMTDIDLISFNSTISGSKVSEYFLADSDLNNTQITVPNETSVCDIFERKEQLLNQAAAGALAIQAFSGFSMNAEPVAGDRPDPVNFIDSETGSYALEIARQATSEELFISGRSSESYQSCLLDEDAVVPYWLFHVSQHSVEEEEEPEELLTMPVPVPLPEPMFDANGNVAPGVGAGAGDGRGMHSDRSQDSSGRGTSRSSSDSSPDTQSYAILIDPSAFVAQFELLREPHDGSTEPNLSVLVDSPDTSFVATEAGEHTEAAGSRDGRRNPMLATSDMDADVSSIDTDVPDSDNE